MFNLGLPGIFWENYPIFVDQLAASQAKTVIVSVSPLTLFDPVACPQVQGPEAFFYLLNERSECLTRLSLRRLLPLSSELPYLGLGSQLPSRAELDVHYKTPLSTDPRELNFLRGQGSRHVLTFTNGDSVVLAARLESRSEERKILNWNARQIPQENLQHLRRQVESLQRGGKTVIVHLEPYKVHSLIDFDVSQLQHSLRPEVKFIFNHLLRVPAPLWADPGHFSYEGNRRFTQLLACQLQELLESRELSCQSERDRLERPP